MCFFKKKIFCTAAFSIILLSGCDSGAGEHTSEIASIEKIDISEAGENFNNDIEKLKTSDFDNISFKDLIVYSFPEFPENGAVHVMDILPEESPSADDLYDFMCEKIDELMPGRFTDEQKEYGIRFADAGLFHEDAEELQFVHPTLQEYKDNHLESEYPWLLFESKEYCFEVVRGWFRGYNGGAAAKRGDSDKLLYSYTLTGTYGDIIYYTADMNSQKSFELSDGSLSIARASDFVNNYLETQKLSMNESKIKYCTDGVKVIDMHNGKYGYAFTIVGKYDGMKIDTLDMREAESWGGYIQNTTNEATHSGRFGLTKSDEPDYFNLLNTYNIAEKETHTSIIPLNKAVEIASDYLTAGIKFKAKNVTAVYKEFSAKKDYESSEAHDNREITARPCWKFTLRPTTGNTNLLYHVYVDMLTGKADVIVQDIREGLEFD